MQILIAHLDKYPLLTQKWADYQLFKHAFEMIVRKEHLTMGGLNKVLSIKAVMNGNGLSDKLNKAFPNLIPIARPSREGNKELIQLSEIYYGGFNLVNQEIYDPSWLIGFIEGESCFFVNTRKSAAYKTGYNITLKFQITQHTRDKILLQKIVNYLGCGHYREITKNCDGKFEVESLKDINNKIIPFFDKYPLVGAKAKDYFDFKEVAELMKKGAHLTPEGVEKIKQIKLRMNRARKPE